MVDVMLCYPAPAALLAHCMRAATVRTEGASLAGSRDIGDVAKLMQWLHQSEAFADYDSWLAAGLALKLEYGDAGLDLWAICHDASVTDDVINAKWNSFADEPLPGMTTLNSLLAKAHKMGWRGSVRKSTTSMFGGVDAVAAMAAAAGASLSSSPGVPMLGRDEKRTEIGKPILERFLADTEGGPSRPNSHDVPQLPEQMSGHGLYDLINSVITRVFVLAEQPRFQQSSVHDVLGLIRVTHNDICESILRRIRTPPIGKSISNSQIQTAANIYHKDVERALITLDEYKRDHKNVIDHSNSDNISVFLKDERLEIRWNNWLECMEIMGGVNEKLSWSRWTYIDDTVVAQLLDWASRTDIGYRPAEGAFLKGLITRSRWNPHDPVCEMLAALQEEWDGVPRLDSWLATTCGVTPDAYHVAVGRNIIGGIVRRVRNPGCKHDTMAIFYGFQGSGKSTMASMLSLDPEWFTDAVMLGDESKELVLSLAGITIAEIGEMGMRGSADASRVKKMISATFDKGRTAYAKSVTKRARRNIFIGTTNDNEPLTDTTGNRRFLPVGVHQDVALDWLRDNVKQLFAEAAVLEAAGETFALPRDVWAVAAVHQEAARSATDMEVMLDDWFGTTPALGPISYVTAKDLALLSEASNWRGTPGPRHAIMRRMGFRTEKPMIGDKRPTVWVRGDCRPANITKSGVRYMPQIDSHGRVSVVLRSQETSLPVSSGMVLPPRPPY